MTLDDIRKKLLAIPRPELVAKIKDSTNHDAKAFIDELTNAYNTIQFDEFTKRTRSTVIDTIIRPFGLASVFFKKKDGGNVTTVHNAKEIRKNGGEDEDKYKYKRDNYSYSDAREKLKERNKVGKHYKDDYTDKNTLDKYDNNNPNSITADHIVPLKKMHEKAGLIFSDKEKERLASDRRNLAATSKEINDKKGDKDLKTFLEETSEDGKTTNAESSGINKGKALKRQKKAEAALREHLLIHYGKKTIITGAKEGLKLGFRQAIGLFLKELVEKLWDEVLDVYKEHKSNKFSKSFWKKLSTRLFAVGENIVKDWKSILKKFINDFKEGAISGFLSNLLTVVINMFLTTSKKMVRMIREGFLSLFQAFKVLAFPPDGMTPEEAGDTAAKMIITALGVTGGIALEEVIGKSLAAFPFANTVSVVLAGLISGLTISFAIYAFDKLDVFGVNDQKRQEYIKDEIDEQIKEKTERMDNIFSNLGI